MVDEELLADGRAGVDVDARLRVGVLGHHARQQRHAELVEHVGQAVDGDGVEAGVAEDDLVEALGRGVAPVGRAHVARGEAAHLGQGA